jgi:uncharacterized SAM-dependent methyltransferase
VTAAFNKNMLAHINRELGGNFDLNAFQHVAFWNKNKSRIEMHLQSLRDQMVRIRDLGRSFPFAKGERIHTENSYKFNTASMRRLLRSSGFKLEKSWTDEKGWFGEALARLLPIQRQCADPVREKSALSPGASHFKTSSNVFQLLPAPFRFRFNP